MAELVVHCPTYLSVKTVDTTGAGDTFCGCCLNYVLDCGLEEWNEERLMEEKKYKTGGDIGSDVPARFVK